MCVYTNIDRCVCLRVGRGRGRLSVSQKLLQGGAAKIKCKKYFKQIAHMGNACACVTVYVCVCVCGLALIRL